MVWIGCVAYGTVVGWLTAVLVLGKKGRWVTIALAAGTSVLVLPASGTEWRHLPAVAGGIVLGLGSWALMRQQLRERSHK